MVTIPSNFSVSKFLAKYHLVPDTFWVDYGGLICPALPALTSADLLDCVVTEAEQAAIIATALEKQTAQSGATTGFASLPDWARIATADDAEAYIQAQIWNGADIATVNAYIDAQIQPVTGSSLVTALTSINTTMTGVRTVFKAAAGAIIAMRGLFILTSRLLVFIRDLVIRWR